MLRFGVIGTNWITESFMTAALQTGEAAFTAVYSRSEETAAAFAAKHGLAFRFTSVEELARCSEVDAVYIASPNAFHARQAIACLQQGKHVICEKPAASNARELEAVLAAAKANRVVFMEAVKSTLQPNFLAVRSSLPKLGQIRRYFASYGQYSSRYDAYKQGTVLNAFNPDLSNGALMDLGIYCIYPLAILFGKPDRVQANAYMLESGADGEGSLLLTYRGMEAVILYSKIADSQLPSEIQGEHGTLIIDKINQPSKAWIRYRDGSIEDLTEPLTLHNMAYEAKHFIDLVASGSQESPINSHASSLISAQIMDEARRQIGLVFPADRS